MKPEVGGWLTRGCEALSLVSLPLPRTIERARERERERERESKCVRKYKPTRARDLNRIFTFFFKKRNNTNLSKRPFYRSNSSNSKAKQGPVEHPQRRVVASHRGLLLAAAAEQIRQKARTRWLILRQKFIRSGAAKPLQQVFRGKRSFKWLKNMLLIFAGEK